MTISVKDLSSMVLDLPTRSRAMLADLLLDSLDEGSSESYETAWLELARRRDAEMSEGAAATMSHEEVMASARKAVKCAR